MLFRKLLRTFKLYKAQFISMIIMITLGIGVFVGFNMEWVSIEENMQSFFKETGYADYRIVLEKGFKEDDLKKISDSSLVKDAARYVSVTADIKEYDGDSVALSVTANEKVSGFIVTDGDSYDPDSKDGIWLSDKYAAANNIKLGDTLTFLYKNIELKGKVKGLIKSGEYMICVRDETQLMPDYTSHGFAFISPKMYEKCIGTDYYPQINVISDADKKAFTEEADRLLQNTSLILSKDETLSYSQAKGESQEGKTMGSVLPVIFLLIAVLTMVTTMHRLTAKEKTQIGTLKALGFKDSRIKLHYTSYALFIGVVGALLGTGLGYLVAFYIMNPNGTMGTYLDLPEWKLRLPLFCILTTLGIVALLTVIGFISTADMLKGTAADALRPYTPKKVKPMLIEKTKLFHKLPFGVRWNMRDIMRHKSRTAMSLIGIIGSMILIIASLGMSDTMDAFLSMYYDGATNYASRIYLSEDASEKERLYIKDKYNGDTSASVSVQAEEKAYSLDIYDITHDRVRFPSKDNSYTALSSDGAYVCMRIADEFSLSPGDTLKISPYGTNKSYTLKIAGIIRSVTENIVISESYAKSLGIDYTVDSVYTSSQKAEISSDKAIKSVQSKQAIIDSFDTFTDIMDSMILLLIAGALVLGSVVLYNLGVMSYTERYREMATLKVVGFKDRKIGRLLVEQNLWLSVLGVILGIPAGYAVLDVLVTKLASEYEMKSAISAATVIFSSALTIAMSLLVSLAVARKNKKIDMAEALKFSE